MSPAQDARCGRAGACHGGSSAQTRLLRIAGRGLVWEPVASAACGCVLPGVGSFLQVYFCVRVVCAGAREMRFRAWVAGSERWLLCHACIFDYIRLALHVRRNLSNQRYRYSIFHESSLSAVDTARGMVRGEQG